MIKAIVFDVDGTLTDGKIYIGEKRELFKAFSVKDGYGIAQLLPKHNIVPIVITARNSKIVSKRCKELGINFCIQGCKNKIDALEQMANKLELYPNKEGIYSEIAFMGDDKPDLMCLRKCGITGCPADADAEIKENVDYITNSNGGDGAAREFIEWLIGNEK